MLKDSQCVLDSGSIISRIIEIERNNKVQLEHTHVKIKQDSNENDNSKGKSIVLKCYVKPKEARIQC